jgi:predicted MFS family arabinose efflux permease
MAVATGAIVANLYYLQPLLHQVSSTFHVGSAAASSLITLTQVGYAAGLVLIVPLGDLHPRRTLVVTVVVIAGLAMAAGALLTSFAAFAAITLVVGVASVGGQIMIPFAADLADPERRGRVVGRLMSGLLAGILLSRTVSGLVAQAAGWRAVYWLAAALMVLLAVLLAFTLPSEAPRPPTTWRRLVTSSFALLGTLPELRRRAWLGAMAFACFSVLWTTLAFLLSGAPYHYSNGVIGLFGLFGLAGVLAANVAGKLADSARTRLSTMVAGALILGSFGLLTLGQSNLIALTLGVIVLDLGVQGMQITNQSIIYALAPDARSRINSAYMFCYFVGGALGSLLAGLAYAGGGWGASCGLGALLAIAGLLPAALEALRTG